MDKNYFNGGCLTCIFAHRDDRDRYISPCLNSSNCSYEEYAGPEPEMTEEEKDNYIQSLEDIVKGALGEELAKAAFAEMKKKATKKAD